MARISFHSIRATLATGRTLLLLQRIALLEQPFQLVILLRDPIRVPIFVLGAGDGSRLLDQLADVVAGDGDTRFEFFERK